MGNGSSWPLWTFVIVHLLNLLKFSDAPVSFLFVPDSTSIAETTAIGTTVYTVLPTGGDGPYSCSITIQDPDDAVRRFDFTGIVLQTVLEFDFETTTRYTLAIECVDILLLTGTTSLTVNIMDVNDEPPVLTGPFTASVQEEAAPGTSVIGLYNVTDLDEEDILSYSFSGSDTNYFAVDGSSGVVSVKQRLDRDAVGARVLFDQLTLMVTDAAGASVSAALTILLTDVNDNTPTFSPSLYYVTASENTAQGQNLVTLTCTDVDENPGNGDITYAVVSGDDASPKFNLSGLTLQTTATALDYEMLSGQNYMYQLTVTGTDAGSPARTGTASIIVRVTGENDNDPAWSTFTPPYVDAITAYGIREDMSAGTSIVLLAATDLDEGHDGVLTYSLDSTTDDSGNLIVGLFRMDAVLGVLATESTFDCDSGPSYYDLIVRVVDSGTPSRSVTRSIRVGILDVNDNPPAFSDDLYEVIVNEASAVSTPLLTLTATDGDVTSNISYFISNGNSEGKFAISGSTELVTQSVIDLDVPVSDPADYTLVITVVDGGGAEELTGSTTVVISVTPLNEFDPVFTPVSLGISQSISADTVLEYTVATVSATDDDYGTDGLVTYSVGSGDPEGNFAVDSLSGVISLIKELDYHALPSDLLELVIVSTDGGGRSASATVNITVLDSANRTVSCSANALYVSIWESLTVGSEVESLSCTGPGDMSYVITSGNTGFTFNITSAGVVQLQNSVDFESGVVRYSLVIGVSGSQTSSTILLTVAVLSVNEWPPAFPVGVLNVSWSENTPVATTLLTFSAADADTGLHGTVEYSISSSSPSVAGLMWLDGAQGDLILLQNLDYETLAEPKYFQVVVTAADGGGSQDMATANVFVSNMNDNSPVCTPSVQVLTLSESTGNETYPVTLITSLGCSDLDDEELTYTLQPNAFGTLFVVDNASGIFNVTGPLDFESETYYSLLVMVSDGGIPLAKSTSVNVLISVSDINDGPPVFTGNFSVSFSESAAIGHFVTSVTATDPDDPTTPEGRLRYSISSGDPDGQFSMEGATGTIRVSKYLDAETISFYQLVIVAAEESGLNTASTTLNITLSDANDNIPVCSSTVYSSYVKEETLPGHVFLSLNCTDADDSPSFATVYYDVALGDPTKFEMIGPNLTLKAVLDFDTGDSLFWLTITASDGGDSQAITVTIYVVSVNEHIPVFTNDAFVVPEDTVPGTVVHQVTATDQDAGQDGAVIYTMEHNPNFFLHHLTGEITLTQYLDRELQDTYTLLISASDSGVPSNNATATVTVTVTDVNDHTPFFSPSLYSLSVSEDTLQGTTLLMLTCDDQDAGINGDISFDIVAGDPGNIFRVEKFIPTNDCRLLVNNATDFDYELYTSFDLIVRATDGSGKFTNASVILQILSYNEFNPVFVPVASDEYLPENSILGSLVVALNATDADKGSDGNISYTMAFSEKFSVDQFSGALTVSGMLDRETKAIYTMDILAIDGGTFPSRKTATYSLTVHIQDMNDHSPVCSRDVYSLLVSEYSTSSTQLLQLSCNDLDAENPNNHLTFDIYNGTDTSVFQITSLSGELFLANGSTFDREITSNYTLTVRISDNGSPSLEIYVLVLIEVTDENDNDPEFCCPPYTKTLLETVPLGTSVIHLMATDTDSPLFGTVAYSITSGNDERKFVIDSSSGLIQTAALLIAGTESVFNLTVTASDSGVPSRTSVVNVTVDTVVDYLPTCEKYFYHATIAEDLNVGQNVTIVSCVDVDDVVLYSLLPSSYPFQVDSNSGAVTVSSALDAETVQWYTMAVTATAGSALVNVTVTVDITDVNEASPEFDPGGIYSYHIIETSPAGTVVAAMNTTDADLRNESYFSITGGDPDNFFQINSLSGVLRVNKTLDYETLALYTLEITAVDSLDVDVMSSSTTVTISLIDINDNPPSCLPSVYYHSINESVVGYTLGLTCSDLDTTPPSLNFSIMYGNTDLDWKINGSTGEISMNSLLDFERTVFYDITVEISDGKFSTEADVFINIEDVNENDPTFSASLYAVTIMENLAVGSSVIVIDASDLDRDDNNSIAFTIESGNAESKFVLDPSLGLLELASPLDRELTAQYNLVIIASDRDYVSADSRSSSVTVTVSVGDINDNHPVFTQDHYALNLPETTLSRSSLVTVSASDDDEGANAAVSYSITSGNDGSLFFLNGSTLSLGIGMELDYETAVFHLLVITAVDGGLSPKSSSALVTLKVVAINEFTPSFPSNASVTISEDVPVGTNIFTASASDTDSLADGSVVYALPSGNSPGSPFFIDIISGIVQVWSELDFEAVQNYSLVVLATDNGGSSSGLSSSMTLIVHLTDVNDGIPTFTQHVFYVSIVEHVPPGSFVGYVVANDTDSGVNGLMHYSLISGDNVITVNDLTGEILTHATAVFDTEIQTNFIFVIGVVDSGTPALSSECLLQLTVSDANDRPPHFEPERFTVYLSESASISTSVTTVFARDLDQAGGGAFFTYIITPTTHFTVNAITGVITLISALDYETQPFHILVATAEDQGSPQLTGTATVTVALQDSNDNPPVVTGVYDESISEDTSLLTRVLTVSAADADHGENSALSFNITYGNTDNAFKIDSDFGLLLVANALDREIQPVYYPVVTITDKGEPPLSTSVTISVTILDVNDVTPSFLLSEYAFDIQEDVSVGAIVGQVQAYDNDTGVNAALIFQLLRFVTGPPHFVIDQSTGNFSTANLLDRETLDYYKLICRVFDSGTPQLFSDVAVNISVTDANDHPPLFEFSSYNVSVYEGEPAGVDVFTFNITDGDIGPNAATTLSIDTSSANGSLADSVFQTSSNTSSLQTKVTIDRESHQSLNFVLLAVDQGVPSLTASTTVSIVILDVNDNDPVFTATYLSKEVAYDGRLTTLVATVNATDPDQGLAGNVSYFMVPSSNFFLFSVDKITGEIHLVTTVESNKTFILYIGAHDNGQPMRSSATYLPVRVDTFDPDLFVVSLPLGVGKTYMESHQDILLADLTDLYLAHYNSSVVRLWYLEERDEYTTDITSRRRRQAPPPGERAVTVHVYILISNGTDDIAHYYTPKTYLLAKEAIWPLLGIWGQDLSAEILGPDWTNFSIQRVELFRHETDPVSDLTVTVICSVAGCLLGVVVVVILVMAYQRRINLPRRPRLRKRRRKVDSHSIQLLPMPSRSPHKPRPNYQSPKKKPKRTAQRRQIGVVSEQTPDKPTTRVDPVTGHVFQYDRQTQKIRWLSGNDGSPVTVQKLQDMRRRKSGSTNLNLAMDQF